MPVLAYDYWLRRRASQAFSFLKDATLLQPSVIDFLNSLFSCALLVSTSSFIVSSLFILAPTHFRYASYKFFNKRLAVPEEEEPAKAKKPKTQDKKGKKEDPKKGKKNAPPEPEPEVEEDKDPLAFEEDEPPAPPPPKEEIPVRKVSTDGLPHGPRMSWEHSEVKAYTFC